MEAGWNLRTTIEVLEVSMPEVRLKRIYDPAAKSDGARVLVDRIWPRGVSKKRAALDLWMKAIASSTELRQWFNHDPKLWHEFRKRYRRELRTTPRSSTSFAPKLAKAVRRACSHVLPRFLAPL